MSIQSAIVRSSLVIAGLTLLAKAMGYGEKLVLAYHFGTGPEVDVYLLIFGVVFSVFVVFRELIEPGVLQVYTQLKEAREEKEARLFFNSVAVGIFMLSLAMVLVGILWPEFTLGLFAPGFEDAKLAQALEIWQWAWPAVSVLALSSLGYIILNAHKEFLVPALGDVFFKGAMVGVLLLFQSGWSLSLLGVAIFAGAIGRLLPYAIRLRRLIAPLQARWNFPRRKDFAALTAPLILGVLFSQLSLLVDFGWGSTLPDGSIAALGYARKIIDLPILIFPYALGIVLFPYFTSFSQSKSKERLLDLFGKASRAICFVFLFLGIFFLFEAAPVVRLLFERGEFKASATAMTALPLQVYGAGIVFLAIETILVLFYFGRGDTRTPVVVGILGVLLNIGLTWVLVGEMGFLGIALALVISKSLKVIVLLEIIRRKEGIAWASIFRFLLPLLGAGVVCALAMWAWGGFWQGKGPDGLVGLLLQIGLSGLIGLLAYLGVAYAFGLRLSQFKLDTTEPPT